MGYNSLDQWPTVSSFFGVVDLKSGSLIVAVLGIVHPAAYCCTCFIPISYLLVSIWILVALYFAASVLLFYGLVQLHKLLFQDNESICIAWTVFMALFVVLIVLMLILMALAFMIRKQGQRAFLVFLGLLYYALTIYFILVVNSHRKTLSRSSSTDGSIIASSRWL
ncbi:uncharacterized protein isoform X1 [Choristoneura fumiferana]|uniref:uncharacterized protein isoform X1 n=1 Tax=Choristoneura fumiferana TaxID=7141 RepID=UPI003D15EECB